MRIIAKFKIRRFKNFYVITSIIFLFFILIFDSYNIFKQWQLKNAKTELEKSKAYYMEAVQKIQIQNKRLMNDDEELERIAREKFYMKKDNEEIFVVINRK